jgi:hypothetical protein
VERQRGVDRQRTAPDDDRGLGGLFEHRLTEFGQPRAALDRRRHVVVRDDHDALSVPADDGHLLDAVPAEFDVVGESPIPDALSRHQQLTANRLAPEAVDSKAREWEGHEQQHHADHQRGDFRRTVRERDQPGDRDQDRGQQDVASADQPERDPQ